MFMFSSCRPSAFFGFWPKLMVFNAAVDAGLLYFAVAVSSGP
jgi:NADH:ubiquinone oxidoreductase subunit 2 (subunit N)